MRVFVGLSGGVDSAVAAYMLQQEGHDVTGVFVRGWEPDWLPCTGTEDRLSAMRVAAHLRIPFKTYDLGNEYFTQVVEPFVAEYAAGRTPNPDVLCNRVIKFGAMWDRARTDGADAVATGHYARVANWRGEASPDLLTLGVAADPGKDQTYFLWTLTSADLAHVLLPLGGLKKVDTRAIARKAGLPNAARPDSQGLCFLGHVNMHQFLSRYIPPKSGSIYGTDGTVLGTHDGAHLYTLGQRIATTCAEPQYVVSKDIARNALVVAPTAAPRAAATSYALSNTNWLLPTDGPLRAQVRYHGDFLPCTITDDVVTFDGPVLVAPGQSLVVYTADATMLVGGGIINECLK